MKRTLSILLAAVLLSGCGGAKTVPAANTAEPPPTVAETESSPAETASASPSATSIAFRNVLDLTYRTRTWYQENGNEIGLFAPADIEKQHFAVYDIDGDGRDELILKVDETYMAASREVIYGYDEGLDTVYAEASYFPYAVYYVGMLKAGDSHNQGLAGDALWPYTLLQYNPASDLYVFGGYADAWDGEQFPKDFDGNPFPAELDTENARALYYVTGEETETMTKSQFAAWEQSVFGNAEKIELPWQTLTRENIDALAPNTDGFRISVTEASDYLWHGEPQTVLLMADEYGVQVHLQSHSAPLLTVGSFPTPLPVPTAAEYTLTDLNGDGSSDIAAAFQYADGTAANVLWLSDGDTLYYNEEFSVLPGEVGPRGE